MSKRGGHRIKGQAVTGKFVACAQCGKEIYRTEYRRDHSKHIFCSSLCRQLFYRRKQPNGGIRKWEPNLLFLGSWCPELAYFLGLMITDGHVQEKPSAVAGFISQDKQLVDFVKNHVTPDQPLYPPQISQTGTKLWYWRAYSVELVQRLIELGITPRKSRVARLPNVPSKYIWDLIRGVLDGDGTVLEYGQLRFTTASIDFSNDLCLLFKSYELKPRIYSMDDCHQIVLRVGDSQKLARLLYHNDPFCLMRKRERTRYRQEVLKI